MSRPSRVKCTLWCQPGIVSLTPKFPLIVTRGWSRCFRWRHASRVYSTRLATVPFRATPSLQKTRPHRVAKGRFRRNCFSQNSSIHFHYPDSVLSRPLLLRVHRWHHGTRFELRPSPRSCFDAARYDSGPAPHPKGTVTLTAATTDQDFDKHCIAPTEVSGS